MKKREGSHLNLLRWRFFLYSQQNNFLEKLSLRAHQLLGTTRILKTFPECKEMFSWEGKPFMQRCTRIGGCQISQPVIIFQHVNLPIAYPCQTPLGSFFSLRFSKKNIVEQWYKTSSKLRDSFRPTNYGASKKIVIQTKKCQRIIQSLPSNSKWYFFLNFRKRKH